MARPGCSTPWEDYLATGGRGMYLAGNGFYWVTTPLPGRPHVLEVRRGESGDAAWRSRPGEMYHSAGGEKGGLWRYRARAPQKIWGTGYTSHTMAVSGYYVQMPDAADPRAAWIMDGIDPGETIGDFGVINEGAAGLEIDRADPSLGTPPNTLLLASSVAHGPNAMLVPEEPPSPTRRGTARRVRWSAATSPTSRPRRGAACSPPPRCRGAAASPTKAATTTSAG